MTTGFSERPMKTYEYLQGFSELPDVKFFISTQYETVKRKFKDDVIRPDEYVDICPTCGGLFNPNPTGRRKRFCSDACRLAWNHKHPHTERWKDTSRTVICPVCQKEFIATREYGRLRRFCSHSCANKGRRRQ